MVDNKTLPSWFLNKQTDKWRKHFCDWMYYKHFLFLVDFFPWNKFWPYCSWSAPNSAVFKWMSIQMSELLVKCTQKGYLLLFTCISLKALLVSTTDRKSENMTQNKKILSCCQIPSPIHDIFLRNLRNVNIILQK